VNTAAITARNTGVYIERYGAGAFTMTNSGAIKSTEGRGLVVISESFDEQGNSIDVTNSGSITSSARDEGAVDLYSEYGGVKLGNTGTISAAGDYASAARVAGNSFDVTNGGTIQATGKGGTGLLLTAFGGLGEEDCIDPTPVLVGTLVNTGKISANGGGSDAGSSPALATGAFAALRGDYGIIRMTNAAGASIEATGPGIVHRAAGRSAWDDEGYGSTGVDAALRFFELDNRRHDPRRRGYRDRCRATAPFDAGDVDLDATGDRRGHGHAMSSPAASRRVNTTDKIRQPRPAARIIGNVDLGRRQ
jgi:fibronectin-binding autotransporter adhesin